MSMEREMDLLNSGSADVARHGDCKCQESSAPSSTNDLEIPSEAEFATMLAGLDGDNDPLGGEFADDMLDATLDLADDLMLDSGDEDATVSLQDLVRFVERNPGLKLTLGY